MSAVLASLAPRNALAEGRAALFGGDPVAAAQIFHGLAEADPTDHESRYWLYSALVAAAQPDAARQVLDEARTLHAVATIRDAGADMARFQTDKGYCAQIGLQLYAQKRMGAASVCLGRSLDVEKLNVQTLLSFGLSLQHQGRMDEATDVFTAAAEVFPNPAIHEFLPTHYWLSFGDLLRDPIETGEITSGVISAVVYIAIFLTAAWARFGSKDVTS